MLDPITWYKQSGICWRGDVVVYVDPWDIPDGEPKADLVMITHAHFDHLQPDDIAKVSTPETIKIAPPDIAAQLSGDVRAVRPGETVEALGMEIQVVPAYNDRPGRLDFHPRDNGWVGYVVPLGGHRYYFAGDTDHTPEVSSVRTDVAFVPIGGTYTMDAEEAAGAIRDISPKVAVPYHFGFVVGSASDGERFVKACAPIEAHVLTPRHPFER